MLCYNKKSSYIRSGILKYSAFIFDFDYTLGDSTEGIVDSINYAFRKMRLPEHTEDEIRKTVGMTMQSAFICLTGNKDDKLGDLFFKLFMERANEVMTWGTSLFPDTIEVLSSIKSKGFKTGIVTTKHHRRIDAILEKYNINDLIDIIIGSDDVKHPKPHPEALLAAAEMLEVDAGEILYTGDSVIDAEAAREANIDFFGVTTGTAKEAELSAYPNVAVACRLSELRYHIMGI
jgi:phosphoglycolate phosphatase